VHLALVSFMQVSDDHFQAESGWNYSALVIFVQVSDDCFRAESGWNCSSILTLLGSSHQKPA
jgi:hypothetical protein